VEGDNDCDGGLCGEEQDGDDEKFMAEKGDEHVEFEGGEYDENDDDHYYDDDDDDYGDSDSHFC